MTIKSPDQTGIDRCRGKHLLLVEDNLAANRGLTRFLQSQGYEVSPVLNGNDAIEHMKGAILPEIVLTDLQLPDLDGREVAEFAYQLSPRPQIGAITAWDVDPESDRRLAETTDWIMLKPLDLMELLDRLSNVDPAAHPTRTSAVGTDDSQDYLEPPGEVG